METKKKGKEAKEVEILNPFVDYIKRRIRHNKNCIMIVVGDTGSGKSYAALRLAELLDPNFDVTRIAFRGHSFLNLLRSDMPKGSVIIFDEGGVEWQSRNFMSFLNKALSYALQTVRFKNHIIILTVPDISFIDAQGRRLVHLILQTTGISRKNNLCFLKPFRVATSLTQKKKYFVYPTIKDKDAGRIKLRRLAVHLPTVKLRHRYEKAKLAFTDKLYAETHDQLVGTQNPVTLSDNERTVFEACRLGIEPKEIATKLGLTRQRVYNLKLNIKNKGIVLPTSCPS